MNDTIEVRTKPPCSIDGCRNLSRVYKRGGLCETHYRQQRPKIPCSVPDCQRLAKATGLCSAHSARLEKWGEIRPELPINGPWQPPICTVDGCNRKTQALGYCGAHYERFRQHGDVMAEIPIKILLSYNGLPCSFEGCERLATNAKLCDAHYRQSRRGIDLQDIRPMNPPRSGHLNRDGYIIRLVNGRKLLDHRRVMEQMIERELLPNETVHHKNGIKTDNSPTNLELWTSNHPAGQRASDLLIWAHQIIDLYESVF